MLASVGNTRYLEYRTFDALGEKAPAGTVQLAVTDPSGTITPHNTAAVTPADTDDGSYGFPLTFNAPGWWQWSWESSGGAALPGFEAGSALVGGSLYRPTPWCTAEDCLRRPQLRSRDVDLAFLDQCRSAATEWLHSRTWRRFRGLREVELRPCCRHAFQLMQMWLVWPMAMALAGARGSPDPVPVMNSVQPCGCGPVAEIELPDDVRQVTRVLIDGDEFDGWRLDSGRRLTRTDHESWPCCSNVQIPETEEGTFSVHVIVGEEVADMASIAASELAVELYLSGRAPEACSTPTRVTSSQTQGQTWTRVDTATLAKDGSTGLRATDLFVSQFGRRRRRAMIASPNLPDLGRRKGPGPL